MPYQKKELFRCAVSGAKTEPVDNDIDDEEVDPRLPPGWLHVVIKRVVPNLDYDAERKERTEAIEAAVALAKGQGATDKDCEDLRTAMNAQQQNEAGEESPFTVEETFECIHPDHAAGLLTALGLTVETMGKGDVP